MQPADVCAGLTPRAMLNIGRDRIAARLDFPNQRSHFRGKSGNDARKRAPAVSLRPYDPDDEDAAIALWLRTWQAAYPAIDFAATARLVARTLAQRAVTDG